MNTDTSARPVRTATKLLLMALVALLAFPTFSISKPKKGDNKKALSRQLSNLIGDFSVQVKDIKGNLKEEAGTIPKEIDKNAFSSTVWDIGNMLYNAQVQHHQAHEQLKMDVTQAIQTEGIDTTDPDFLRGNGGCADKQIEEFLWMEPGEFGKDLQEFGRKIRFLIRAFQVSENGDVLVKPHVAAQINQDLEDAQIFTAGMYTMMPYMTTMETRIGAIFGASYGDPNNGQTVACAGVFGWAAPGSTVNVIASGLNGPFMGSTMADSNGTWGVQLEGLSHGYYEFKADNGSSQDIRELGFVQVQVQF